MFCTFPFLAGKTKSAVLPRRWGRPFAVLRRKPALPAHIIVWGFSSCWLNVLTKTKGTSINDVTLEGEIGFRLVWRCVTWRVGCVVTSHKVHRQLLVCAMTWSCVCPSVPSCDRSPNVRRFCGCTPPAARLHWSQLSTP